MPGNSSNIGSNSNESEAHSLRCEFRTINMLLALVTAINNEGRSILNVEPYHSYLSSILESPEPSAMSLLNAISAILVRDNEIVAVVSSHAGLSPGEPYQVVAISDLQSPPDAPHQNPTIQDLPDEHAIDRGELDEEMCRQIQDAREWHEVDFKGIQQSIGSFATLGNPDLKDKYFKMTDHHYIVAPTGTSHWQNIKEDSWYGLVTL
jgi:hypothetical protein